MAGTGSSVRARARGGSVRPPALISDPALLDSYAEDASGRPPGRPRGLLRPATEEEAAAFLRETAGTGIAILAQGARSSLTGGAIPQGEVVVSTERWTEIGPVERDRTAATLEAGAGVILEELEGVLAARGYFYPPVPTFAGATLGGTVATNAAGAATFKYGTTRSWVQGLAVLLYNGDLLEIERREAVRRPGESFRIELSDGRVLSVPVPTYRLPPLKKISAGYHASEPLDLVDLFIGSEGTLGLISRVRIRILERPPAVATGLVFVPGDREGLELAAELREVASAARGSGREGGADLRAIEWLDSRSLRLIEGAGELDRLRVRRPPPGSSALIFELELHGEDAPEDLDRAVSAPGEAGSVGGSEPLEPFLELLARRADLDWIELALSGDEKRVRSLRRLREAAPAVVNELLAARRASGAAVHKVGGDLIVPVHLLPEFATSCVEAFARRGIDCAVWGHVSDGNLHPNALPRDEREVEAAEQALLELADRAVALGGCPLSEHGVGRNPLKQEMLRRFLGDEAIAEMWAIKRALDPEGRFAPGVLLPPL